MGLAEEARVWPAAVGQHASAEVQQIAGYGQVPVDVYMRAVNRGDHPVGGRVGGSVGAQQRLFDLGGQVGALLSVGGLLGGGFRVYAGCRVEQGRQAPFTSLAGAADRLGELVQLQDRLSHVQSHNGYLTSSPGFLSVICRWCFRF